MFSVGNWRRWAFLEYIGSRLTEFAPTSPWRRSWFVLFVRNWGRRRWLWRSCEGCSGWWGCWTGGWWWLCVFSLNVIEDGLGVERDSFGFIFPPSPQGFDHDDTVTSSVYSTTTKTIRNNGTSKLPLLAYVSSRRKPPTFNIRILRAIKVFHLKPYQTKRCRSTTFDL